MAATDAIQSARPITTFGPRPLIVVHLSTSILGTACGRVPGMRRFDPEHGSVVQDSAHLTLRADFSTPGAVVCPECLGLAGVL